MKRALLCVCPPYPATNPPAGAAALLGYLKAHNITDFGFLDLRLGTPGCYEATYSPTGVFGESFVMDVPDPEEDVVVSLSPYVVIRSLDRLHGEQILAVNYVNGRSVRCGKRQRAVLEALSKEPMNVPAGNTALRRSMEKLHRLGIVVGR